MSVTTDRRPADLPQSVRLGNLDGAASDQAALLAEVRRGRPHEDLRDWLQMVDAAGDLRVLRGVDWEENIGRVTEMLQHTEGAPAVLFDDIPGYPSGYRILVNAQSERGRLAITLGLPLEIATWELMDEWERRMDETRPLPPALVTDGPDMENVLEALDVDVFRFPAPHCHP